MTGLTIVDSVDGTVTVALEERLLAQGLADLRWRLLQVAPGGTDTLAIDVSGVARLSSACIATLLFVKRACAARGVHVVLFRPTVRTRDQLVRTGLADVLEIGSPAS